MTVPDLELIGEDDGGRPIQLRWADRPGWVLRREVAPGQWGELGTFSEAVPVAALPFARWLLRVSGLHPDIVEEAVYALSDEHPGRFRDRWDDENETGAVTEIHLSDRDRMVS